MNVRVAAAKVIASVLNDEGSLSTLLPQYAPKVEERDRGLLQQLCYGTLRYYPRIAAYLNLLLAKPFKAKDRDLEAVLACSLYQLLETRVPSHAAVNEAVAACKALKKLWAKGLVNAVLRRFLRERAELDVALKDNSTFNTVHPDWLRSIWQEAWPQQLDNIVLANNTQPPMTLRVNHRHLSREAYLERLSVAGIEATAAPFSSDGITLKNPQDVLALPGFTEGDVSVQDEAAQLSAQLLGLEPGQRVLDACCAPGGKTCHILELLDNTGEVVALDIAANRLERVEENLERLGLQAELIAADATDTNTWWDNKPFDRILLDAPCSATGVIRRHPDVKLLRKPADVAKLAELQLTLLKALWPLLEEGGVLLYATCSTLPQENDQVILEFIRSINNASVEKVAITAGMETPVGRQLLPQVNGHDGFYYALLRKTATD
ncbi:MAG: 16S rRNA (cytosine(967)-C(5))-methyltransferase RsmB [Porticoccus sp.]|nr:16S rRNA (cytosine(967)-C(5))-methyltransferase RsmB [Porticoccus sp.]